jgi:hypothetical protein
MCFSLEMRGLQERADSRDREAVRTARLADCEISAAKDAAMDCREGDRWTIRDAEKAAAL